MLACNDNTIVIAMLRARRTERQPRWQVRRGAPISRARPSPVPRSRAPPAWTRRHSTEGRRQRSACSVSKVAQPGCRSGAAWHSNSCQTLLISYYQAAMNRIAVRERAASAAPQEPVITLCANAMAVLVWRRARASEHRAHFLQQDQLIFRLIAVSFKQDLVQFLEDGRWRESENGPGLRSAMRPQQN